MDDFAKASLVNLVVHYVERHFPGLLPEDAVIADAVRNAYVPADTKRGVLDAVWREAGPATLLAIGQEIRSVEYDPLWHAAIRSATPVVLLDKWLRCEQFAHSQNRLRIGWVGDKCATFERYALGGGTPTAAENLLVCGVVIAMLEEIGCGGVRCEMTLADGSAFFVRADGRFRVPGHAAGLTAKSWRIDWQSFSAPAARRATDTNPPEIPLPPSSEPAVRAVIEKALGLLSRDAGRQWNVGELAQEVGASTRSLQRRFTDAGLSFSRLVRLVRVHEACRLLKKSDVPITVIGFCAGFSDSAHFSRDFRASTGMTPSDYRGLIV